MDSKIFAYQTADLDKHIKELTQKIAEAFSVDASMLQNTWSRDDMTRKLNEQKALIAFLESLLQVKPVTVAEVLAIEGLAKGSVKLIKERFGVSDGDTE